LSPAWLGEPHTCSFGPGLVGWKTGHAALAAAGGVPEPASSTPPRHVVVLGQGAVPFVESRVVESRVVDRPAE
jgi:hypothetical protein